MAFKWKILAFNHKMTFFRIILGPQDFHKSRDKFFFVFGPLLKFFLNPYPTPDSCVGIGCNLVLRFLTLSVKSGELEYFLGFFSTWKLCSEYSKTSNTLELRIEVLTSKSTWSDAKITEVQVFVYQLFKKCLFSVKMKPEFGTFAICIASPNILT